VRERAEPAIPAQWARARLRDLEDAYAAGNRGLEQRIVATSLRYGVLCRFTAFVAVDTRVVNEGGEIRRVTQPVELPSGWEGGGDVAPAMLRMSAVSPVPPAPPSAAAPGGPAPRFAPARAEATGVARSRGPVGFATVPSALRAGKMAVPSGAAPTLDQVREIAATEATRLREAAGLPAYERRDRLDDLSSRLEVLLGPLPDKEFNPLHDLVTFLTGGASLDEKWARALEVLTAFGGDPAQPQPDHPSRKPFWKR
jgi:Ca-activated chloride channel homolog